jgi:hypothetical protein
MIHLIFDNKEMTTLIRKFDLFEEFKFIAMHVQAKK